MKQRARFLFILLSIPTAALLAGQFFHLPSAVRDAVTGEFPQDIRLAYPFLYTVFAPFCQIADRLTFFTYPEHISFAVQAVLLGLLFYWMAFRRPVSGPLSFLKECGKAFLVPALLLLSVAAVTLSNRPTARLETSDPDLLFADFHSHTNYSWDALHFFTPAKNILWHERAGFHACFITDHNVFGGTEEGNKLFLEGRTQTASLRGEEVSLHRSHWVALGNKKLIVNSVYDDGLGGIERFLKDMDREGVLTIASLPEYWKYHWADLEKFSDWGVKGFEIVNSAPQGLSFPSESQNKITDLCKERDLILTGASDNHGWARAAYVWNVLKIPGWRKIPKEDLEQAVIDHLKKERNRAVQVIVRIKAEPKEGSFWFLLNPARQFWETARSMPFFHALSCLLWLWLPAFFFRKK